ncbi:hypothetical protein CSC75_02305 [Pseudoxanthomonas wuyuanensis]|nr:hypothetical protein CSC75_02305 [Pseudoxanthomonas wuyuanensis]
MVRYARSVDWPAVAEAMAGYRPKTIAAALALVTLSYLIYCGYELSARAHTGHGLPARRVMLMAFIGYAFSLNLGAWVGGGGLRLRMYTRNGVRPGVVAHIAAFAIAANWSGYLLLAGAILAARAVRLPENWSGGAALGLQALGVAMLLLVGLYLWACARWPHRPWSVRGQELRLPSLPMAALQLGLSAFNWMTIAGVVFVLMPEPVDYLELLGVLLTSAILAAAMHIPAGLGALEGAFLVMLGGQVAKPQLLATLLAYRAMYYLLPMLLAVPAYLALEAKRRGTRTGKASD